MIKLLPNSDDYADITYNTILSIFISCPLLFLSNGKDITTVKQIVEGTGEEWEGEEGLRAEVEWKEMAKALSSRLLLRSRTILIQCCWR
jgi:hypothetical protein